MRKLSFSLEFIAGICIGYGISLLRTIYLKWNPQLSWLINIFLVAIPEIVGRKSIHDIGDSDLDKINQMRVKHSQTSLGSSVPIETSWKVEVQSEYGHSIPVWYYKPLNYQNNNPIIVWIHGGGFVLGNTKMYESILTKLAAWTGCIVASIDYRKAPEHKFPEPVNDCIEATQWIYDHAADYGADKSRLVVLGDSAGGTLTIAVTCELKELVKLSIPIYPAISFGVLSETKISHHDAPILKALSVDWYNLRYFKQRSDMIHPLATPLGRKDLHLLPRTHVITAECDVLIGEGQEYVQLLQKNGVTVTYRNYPNTVHGFFGVELLTHGTEALRDTCDLIKSHFSI